MGSIVRINLFSYFSSLTPIKSDLCRIWSWLFCWRLLSSRLSLLKAADKRWWSTTKRWRRFVAIISDLYEFNKLSLFVCKFKNAFTFTETGKHIFTDIAHNRVKRQCNNAGDCKFDVLYLFIDKKTCLFAISFDFITFCYFRLQRWFRLL